MNSKITVAILTLCSVFVHASEKKPLLSGQQVKHQTVVQQMQQQGSVVSQEHLHQFLQHLQNFDREGYNALVGGAPVGQPALTRARKGSHHAAAAHPAAQEPEGVLADLEKGGQQIAEQMLGKAAQFGYQQLQKEHAQLQGSHKKTTCAAATGWVITLFMGGMNYYCKSK